MKKDKLSKKKVNLLPISKLSKLPESIKYPFLDYAEEENPFTDDAPRALEFCVLLRSIYDFSLDCANEMMWLIGDKETIREHSKNLSNQLKQIIKCLRTLQPSESKKKVKANQWIRLFCFSPDLLVGYVNEIQMALKIHYDTIKEEKKHKDKKIIEEAAKRYIETDLGNFYDNLYELIERMQVFTGAVITPLIKRIRTKENTLSHITTTTTRENNRNDSISSRALMILSSICDCDNEDLRKLYYSADGMIIKKLRKRKNKLRT